MMNLDNVLAKEYLAECCEHLANMEADLLALENGAKEEKDLVNRVFRAVHSVEGGASFFDLVKIRELAHQAEQVLAPMRTRDRVPTVDAIQALLRATDRLNDLVRSPASSNQADIAADLADLAAAREGKTASVPAHIAGSAKPAPPLGRPLRVLLAEDDFTSRLVLQTFLSRYGECHVAVNGREAVEAFRSAWERGEHYDLICMDIMMPEMDGCEAVKQVRAHEEAHGVFSTSGARIVMTTTVHDIKKVIRCFQELCDAYLVKPIDLSELVGHLKSYGLMQ